MKCERIPLPPPARHLGRRVRVRLIDGKDTVGVLSGADAWQIRMRLDGGVATLIPYSLIDFAVSAEQDGDGRG